MIVPRAVLELLVPLGLDRKGLPGVESDEATIDANRGQLGIDRGFRWRLARPEDVGLDDVHLLVLRWRCSITAGSHRVRVDLPRLIG